MPPAPPHFTVSGKDGRHCRTATRLSVSSALVLADRWAIEGLMDITLINPEGDRFDRAGLRSQLPILRRLAAVANRVNGQRP